MKPIGKIKKYPRNSMGKIHWVKFNFRLLLLCYLLDYEPGDALGRHGDGQEDIILTVEGIDFWIAFFFADFSGLGQAGVI